LDALARPKSGSASPGKLKNQLVRQARGRYVLMLSGALPPASSFLEHALGVLERAPELSFVASWLDGLPSARDRRERPLGASDVISRPWFQHAPTLFRRELWTALSGFDEGLAALDDLDFWLRALAHGAAGCAIEEPGLAGPPFGGSLSWSDAGAREAAREVFERHRALFEADLQAVIVGKERVIRELFAATRAVESRTLELEREERRLSRALARSAGS
jgi:hypothetical protein